MICPVKWARWNLLPVFTHPLADPISFAELYFLGTQDLIIGEKADKSCTHLFLLLGLIRDLYAQPELKADFGETWTRFMVNFFQPPFLRSTFLERKICSKLKDNITLWWPNYSLEILKMWFVYTILKKIYFTYRLLIFNHLRDSQSSFS